MTGVDSVIAEVSNKNVYIYEPDESLEYLIRTALELQGYEVQTELILESAIQPAVIVLDSGENLENLEFLRKLKSLQNFVNTKVIVTTTFA